MLVHVNFEDVEYPFDLDDVDVPEGRYIKNQTGLTLLKFQEGIMESDPDCLVLAYWLMQKKSGTVIDPRKVNFNLGKFSLALGQAYTKAIEEAQARGESPLGEPATA